MFGILVVYCSIKPELTIFNQTNQSINNIEVELSISSEIIFIKKIDRLNVDEKINIKLNSSDSSLSVRYTIGKVSNSIDCGYSSSGFSHILEIKDAAIKQQCKVIQ